MSKKSERQTTEQLLESKIGMGFSHGENLFKIDEDKKDEVKETGTNDEKEAPPRPLTKEERQEQFIESIKECGYTVKDIEASMLEIIQTGEMTKHGFIFNGRIPYVFKSRGVEATDELVSFFEENPLSTIAASNFFYNLYSLASILVSYNGKELPKDIKSRVKWIEDNIHRVPYKAILAEAGKFHRYNELLGEEEALIFF